MRRSITLITTMSMTSLAAAQLPVGSAFTYQGRLTENGQPADGYYDFSIDLMTSALGGSPIATSGIFDDYLVTDGVFTVTPNFGPAALNIAEAHWLRISVRHANDAVFTELQPRQRLTPAPYAIGLALPYAATFGTDGFEPLFSLTQTGDGHGIEVGVKGGTALYGRAEDSGDNTATGVFGHCVGASGIAGLFIRTSESAGDSLRGEALGLGNAVRGVTYGSGAALRASSSGGPALQIDQGGIRVTGAGQDTPTPVFVHVVTSQSLTGNWNSIIDHPQCNNRPNAMLIITEIAQSSSATRSAPVGVRYSPSDSRWRIFSFGTSGDTDGYLATGDKFAVLVVNP